jgi:simple sugar transport system substrate-binding protein
MKRLSVVILTLALVSNLGFAACGGGPAEDPSPSGGAAPPAESDAASGGLIVVGFSQVGAESDWRAANTKSMQETFKESNGYKLLFDDAQQNQENQITAIRNFIQQEVNYIVLAPIGETGWDTVLQEARDAKIPVIIVDRMIDVADDSLFTCWVGSDFRKEGDTAVAWIKENVKKDGNINIVHLQGTIGSSAQIGRTEGLEAGLKSNSRWKLVAQQTGEFTKAKGQEVMEGILDTGKRIDVVYAENDNMAFGAIDALEAAGKKAGVGGDITVISFDATNQGLQWTLAGKINYNVECNPLHGPRVDAIIKQLENGETPEKMAYVDEEVFDAKTMTQEMLDARSY